MSAELRGGKKWLRAGESIIVAFTAGVRAAILLSCETDSPMGQAHGGLYAEECDSY